MLLLVSFLLAQTSPAPAASVAPLVAAATDAVIKNSGSTNAAGYTIVLHPDATAELRQNGTTVAKTVAKAQAAKLFDQLHATGRLDALPIGHCMRSASFGSTTTVTYAGHTSGDLGCNGGDPNVIALQTAVAAIANQLGATAFSARYRRPL
jgi:hypothetical protein